MNEKNDNILGCFISSSSTSFGDSQEVIDITKEKGVIFRNYILGEKGISSVLKKLKHENYGNDLKLVLFQFYVNPIPYILEHLKSIESYRKNEKSIGIPVIVNDENFFNQTESARYDFFRESILQKVDLLSEVVKKKKLDTNMELLKADLKNLLNTI